MAEYVEHLPYDEQCDADYKDWEHDLACWLVAGHDGPHWDMADKTTWELRVIVQPVPALTPSADLPACRDEDPAHAATLAAAYPDPPEYQHPEDDRCISCGAEIDHYLGCPDDPNPDYEAEAQLREAQHE